MPTSARPRSIRFEPSRPASPTASSPLTLVLLAGLLVALTLLAFWPILDNGFLVFDDDQYITANPAVLAGLTWRGLVWALTSVQAANWHPLTWLSHMADVSLFGLSPAGHHGMSLGLHLAAALVFFWFLARTTRSPLAAWLVAALFALHPLRLESVAWAAERKDVLAALLWGLTLVAYAAYVRRPQLGRYLLVALSLTLGLLAKPMLVTLPVVLLLLDIWPLRRLDGQVHPVAAPEVKAPPSGSSRRKAKAAYAQPQPRSLFPSTPVGLLVEKLPLLALCLASSAMTIWAQSMGGAMLGLAHTSLGQRLANALVSCVAYVGKFLLPVDLTIFYPFREHVAVAQWAGAVVLLAAITAACMWLWKRTRAPLVGWGWYVVSLLPVLGIIHVGLQGMADRYAYIPGVGLAILVVYGGQHLLRQWPRWQPAAAMAAGVALLALAATTWYLAPTWKNSDTVFSRALAISGDHPLSLVNAALSRRQQGDLAGAETLLRRAREVAPQQSIVLLNLGLLARQQAAPDTALEWFAQAAEAEPSSGLPWYQRGLVLAQLTRSAEALAAYDAALERSPGLGLHYDRGLALTALGRNDEAMASFRQAIGQQPFDARARHALGTLLLQARRLPEAEQAFRQALVNNPRDDATLANLGVSLALQGRYREAAMVYGQALAINPQNQNAARGREAALAEAARLGQ